jgi:hypothetical protein
MENDEARVQIPVYSYSCRVGASFKKFFTLRAEIDGKPMLLEGHIGAPEGSRVVINNPQNATKGVAHLAVPRPGINRFVTFCAADAIRAAARGSFRMTWEEEIR